MDHATLAAIHGVEAERLGGPFHFFRRGVGAEAKLGDSQHTEIVGIEGQARMIVGGETESLHRDVLQSEQEFGLIGKQELDIGSLELDDHFRILDLGIGGISGLDFILDVEVRIVEDHVEELFDARS